MAGKIYTKTGDLGKTSLIGGTKVLKSDFRIEGYGSVDELNSYLGLVGDLVKEFYPAEKIKEIQDRLFTIGSSLACDPEKDTKMALPDLSETDISFLEKEIDEMTGQLEPIRFFILPGGNAVVSNIHIARCVCRRSERAIVRMQANNEQVEPDIIKYLNRLSDYLFTLARFAAHKLQVPEIRWEARVTKQP